MIEGLILLPVIILHDTCHFHLFDYTTYTPGSLSSSIYSSFKLITLHILLTCLLMPCLDDNAYPAIWMPILITKYEQINALFAMLSYMFLCYHALSLSVFFLNSVKLFNKSKQFSQSQSKFTEFTAIVPCHNFFFAFCLLFPPSRPTCIYLCLFYVLHF